MMQFNRKVQYVNRNDLQLSYCYAFGKVLFVSSCREAARKDAGVNYVYAIAFKPVLNQSRLMRLHNGQVGWLQQQVIVFIRAT